MPSTYYVSRSGSDSNSGKTIDLPWLTVAKVNAASLVPGDQILFRNGDSWNETLIIAQSGSALLPITVNTYSYGQPATLNGSVVAPVWLPASGNSNIITAPEAIGGGAWTVEHATIAVNAPTITDPHGTHTAAGLIPDTAAANAHQTYFIANASPALDYTGSVFVKPAAKDWLGLIVMFFDASFAFIAQNTASFNASDGTISSQSGGANYFNLEGKNGWRRIGLTGTAPALTAHVFLFLQGLEGTGDALYVGDATNPDVYLWGAQLEQASAATQYGASYSVGSIAVAPYVVFQNQIPLKRCTVRAALQAGCFYYDTPSTTVYVKTLGYDQPAGSTLEIAQLTNNLVVFGAAYVTVAGIRLRQSNEYNAVGAASSGTDLGRVLDGLTVAGGQGILDVDGNGSIIRNCDISGTVAEVSAFIGGITFQGAGTGTSQSNYVHGVRGYGLVALGARVVSSNDDLVTDTNNDQPNGADGILALGTAVLTCTRAEIARASGDGFTVSDSASHICVNCRAHDNGNTIRGGANASGDGYTSHLTSTLKVRFCRGWNNTKSGVAVANDSQGEILNNVFVNNRETTADQGTDPWLKNLGIGIRATGTWVVKNNITQGNGTEIMVHAESTGSLTIDYNLYNDSLGGSAFHWKGTDYNFAGWKTASGGDSHSLNADPLLVSVAGLDFSVLRGSPAINAGVATALTTDARGQLVPQGTLPDMGAFEFPVSFGLLMAA